MTEGQTPLWLGLLLRSEGYTLCAAWPTSMGT